MTSTEFSVLCNERLIDEGVALDNEDIKSALLDRDDKRVIEVLDEQF